MTENELEQELSTNAVNGLTKKAAAAKRRRDGSNIVFRLPHGSFSSYFKDIMSDSASVILILAALIASIFNNTVTSYVIAGIIALNCFVTVFTYVKAHRVLEGMGEYSLPGAKVIREGHLYLVNMNSLVPGDLIYLKAGDIVPADARIIGAESFYVSEKGITGNVSAIRKSPQNVSPDNETNENMFNMVFATSVVLKGTARAIVVETGENTLVSRTDNNNLEFEHDSLDVFVMLKKYGSKISMLMLVMVFVIMFLEIITGLNTRGLYEIFLGGMSLAVAAMTEFYTAFGYIIVACGLFGARTYRRKSSNSVILKNITAIEKLRDINCVMFKKDGILTERNKAVDAMYASGQIFRTKDYDKPDEGFAHLLEAAVITTGMYMRSSLARSDADRAPTPDEEAILECAKKYGLYNIELELKYPLVTHKSAIGNTSYDYTVVKKNGKLCAYIRGFARTVTEMCSEYSIGSASIPIDAKIKVDLSAVIAEYEKVNTGVYAVAMCEITQDELNAIPNFVMRKKNMTLVGFLALKAPLFEGCALTIDKLTHSGIKLIVNSPSASSEDLATAKSLGICTDDRDILTERVFESMTDETLKATVHAYSVYMGLKNSSLRKIVTTLRENGYNVAYCAGSLSDISVLECADIGYTHAELPEKLSKQDQMTVKERGASPDALRFKSDVIIPGTGKRGEGGILSIERSILTAKLVYKNLMNMFAYLISVQFARLFIVLYSVFTQTNLLTPVQILTSGLIFDFLAVLSIAFARPGVRTLADYDNAKREMKALPRFLLRYALFGVFWAVMTIFVPMIMTAAGFTITKAALVSTSFVSFTVLQMLTLAEIKRSESIFDPSAFSLNPFYIMTFVTAVLFIVVCALVPGLGSVMGVVMPDTNSLLAILFIVIAVTSLHEVYKSIANKN